MLQLSIILPIHNEKDTIESVLTEWKEILDSVLESYEFILCEDGSTDGTKDLLPKLAKKYPIQINSQTDRRGYGRAVIDGITSAKSMYILCIDSDGQCDPKDFINFWQNRDKSDVLIGWRTSRQDTAARKLFSSSFKIAFKLLFPSSIHDPSAPYVLFKKKNIIPFITYLHFLNEGFWWGFVGTCHKKHLSISELPIHHRKRLKGNTQVYKPAKITGIALRNLQGLIILRFA